MNHTYSILLWTVKKKQNEKNTEIWDKKRPSSEKIMTVEKNDIPFRTNGGR